LKEKAAPMTNPIADPLVEAVDSDATSTLVRLETTRDGAATVWINRPERKNAFDSLTIAALKETFETLRGAEGVRIVFVRGAGGSFSAGADIAWMRDAVDLTEDDNKADALDLAHMLKTLSDLPMLTVALVEGSAFGGGVGLVAACDMALATKDAKFAFSEVKLGLVPATISPYVVAAIGPRASKALFSTGRIFDGAYAEKIGLVDEVVADSAALDAAQAKLEQDIMACAPGAVAASKALVDLVASTPLDGDLIHETAKRIASARVSPEGQEGVRAFLDKRKASWTSL
jgi:methylglutaconyl-CoA hydratase